MIKKYFVFTIFIFVCTLLNAQNSNEFEHSMWEWFSAANVSEARLKEFAPNFPHPKDVNYNLELYNQEIFKWQKVYCFEYEAFINAPELTALNPYYKEYEDIIQLPYFLGPLENNLKPNRANFNPDFEGEVDYALTLQNWYFVFKPNEFKKLYGEMKDLPFWFDEEVYRQSIIKKIEDNKNVSKEDYKN